MTDEASSDGVSDPLHELKRDGDRSQIDLMDREYAIYRCRDCNNVVLTMQDCDGG